MRTDVELWIAGRRADLGDASFILMTWTQEELSSPAVVRNSFSKQVTLPGSPANNAIFGSIYRNDRRTQYGVEASGPMFDPTRKTEFRLYNDRSELMESGYLRLNGIDRKGAQEVSYKVTLYGGLGSFIYGLTYDEAGEKRTLAGLDYMQTQDPDTEFDFTLNAAAVSAAWARLAEAGGALSQVWDYINFAPAYNGLPSGTFDANKGMLDVVAAGLSDGRGTVGGLALVTLSQSYTEWMTKDLRSYLQRPVVRLRAIVEAISRSGNNGGWSVTLDPAFFSGGNPYYNDTWLTLPIVSTDNAVTQASGSGTLTLTGTDMLLEATVPDYAAEREFRVTMQDTPTVGFDVTKSGTLYMHCEEDGTVWMSVLEVWLQGYDAGGVMVASDVVRISSRQVPAGSEETPVDLIGTFLANGGTTAQWQGSTVQLGIAGRGISRVVVRQQWIRYKFGTGESWHGTGTLWTSATSFASGEQAARVYVVGGAPAYTWSEIEGGRSGKAVTKAALLSGGGTPADYLVGLCKAFGLTIVADMATKTVEIRPRSTFFRREILDITDRVDTDSVAKDPFAFSAKWYVWAASYASGEWAKIYSEKYGRTFGQMRVDTGFDFDANTTQVLDGVVYKGAVMALENSKYYCTVRDGAAVLPSVLLDRGAKFSVIAGDDSTEDIDILRPGPGATITWMNARNATYDLYPKAQLHDAEQKAADGANVLLFFDGMEDVAAADYALTDDTQLMIAQNNGTPCWLLNWAVNNPSSRVSRLPRFSRYVETTEQHQGYVFVRSLDYGTPAEIPMPGADFSDCSTVYDIYWRDYISDRYDDDSAVVRCKVNWAGMQVGASLLRQFYWFDGAVWSLNRIINHSVTTADLTECEFVKVQDVDNYLR